MLNHVFKTKFDPISGLMYAISEWGKSHCTQNLSIAALSISLSFSFSSKSVSAVECVHQTNSILSVNSASCDYNPTTVATSSGQQITPTTAIKLSGNALVNWQHSPAGAVLFSSDFSQSGYDWTNSALIHSQDNALLKITGPLKIQSTNDARGGTAIIAKGNAQIQFENELSLDGGNAAQRQLHITDNAAVSVNGSFTSAGWSSMHPAPARVDIDRGSLILNGSNNRITNRTNYALPLAGVPSDVLVQNGSFTIPQGGLFLENRHVGVVNSTLLKLISQNGNTDISGTLHLSPASSSAIYMDSTTRHRAGELLINDPATMTPFDKGRIEQKALIQLASGELLFGRANIGQIGQARNVNEYTGILIKDQASAHGIVFASGQFENSAEAQLESHSAKILLDNFRMTSVGDAIAVENSPNLNKVLINNQASSQLQSARGHIINTSRFAYKPGRTVEILNKGNLINMNGFRYIVLGGDNDESFTSSAGMLGGEIRMGKGNDHITLSNTNVNLLRRLDGEEDNRPHSSDNILTINQELTARSAMSFTSTALSNWSTINVGTAQPGNLKLAGDLYANRQEASILGKMNIAPQGTLSLNTNTPRPNLFYHVHNQGKIDLSNGSAAPNSILTVKGNYEGETGSKLLLKTHWDQPNTQHTDKLVIEGNVSGQTIIEAVGHIQGNVALTLADRGTVGVTERPRQLDREEILYREENIEGAQSADRIEVLRTPRPYDATRQIVTHRGSPTEIVHTLISNPDISRIEHLYSSVGIETQRTEHLESIDENHDINADGIADGILKTFRTHIETRTPAKEVEFNHATPITRVKTTVTPIETVETIKTPVDVESITRYDVEITNTKYKTVNRWFSTILEKINLSSPVVTVLGTDHGTETSPSFVGTANLANSAEVAQIAKVGNSYYWKIIATFTDAEMGNETVEEVRTRQEPRDRSRVSLQETEITEQRTQGEEQKIEQATEILHEKRRETREPVLSAYDTWRQEFIPFAALETSEIPEEPNPTAPYSKEPLIYAKETASYLQTQWANRQMGLDLLGKLHDRVGEQQFSCYCINPQTWSRLEYQDRQYQGDIRFGLKNKGGLVQFGHDLFLIHTPNKRSHSGISVGYQWANNQFYDKFNSEHGYVIANKQTSQSKSHLASLGAYHTTYYKNGSYIDLVGQFLWAHNRFLQLGERPSQQGYGFAASLEAGKYYPLHRDWYIQPQLQLRGQTLRLSSIKDGLRTTAPQQQNTLQARAGLRLTNGYLHFNTDLVQDLLPTRTQAKIGITELEERFARTYLDMGLGGEMPLPQSKKWIIYADLKYSIALGKHHQTSEQLLGNHSFSGRIGGRYQW